MYEPSASEPGDRALLDVDTIGRGKAHTDVPKRSADILVLRPRFVLRSLLFADLDQGGMRSKREGIGVPRS